MFFKRFGKSLAALVVGLAAAAALLPTDADPKLLAGGVILNTFAVWLAPYAKRNPPTGLIENVRRPGTTYRPTRQPGDPPE
jgi:hypothetical protein